MPKSAAGRRWEQASRMREHGRKGQPILLEASHQIGSALSQTLTLRDVNVKLEVSVQPASKGLCAEAADKRARITSADSAVDLCQKGRVASWGLSQGLSSLASQCPLSVFPPAELGTNYVAFIWPYFCAEAKLFGRNLQDPKVPSL